MEYNNLRLKSLVKSYAGITDKKSLKAKRIIRLINIIRGKRNLKRLLEKQMKISEYNKHAIQHNKKILTTCTRCGGNGMGVYYYIADGVCFRCGRLPIYKVS